MSVTIVRHPYPKGPLPLAGYPVLLAESIPHGLAAGGIPPPFRRRRRRPSRGFPKEYVVPLTLHESELLHVGLQLLVPDSAGLF